MLGRSDEALAESRKLQDALTAAKVSRGDGRFMTAFLLSRVGRYREAAAEIAAGLKDAGEVQSAVQIAALQLLSRYLAIERGDRSDPTSWFGDTMRSVNAIPEFAIRQTLRALVGSLDGIIHA